MLVWRFLVEIVPERTGLFALEKGKEQTGHRNNLGEGLWAVATVAGL